MEYFETSCKLNKNVDEVFHFLGKQILKTKYGVEIKEENEENKVLSEAKEKEQKKL